MAMLSAETYYIFNERREVIPVDLFTWGRWLEEAERQVAYDEVADFKLSTVLLGLDMNYSGNGPPLIFETMITGPDIEDGVMARWATEEQAISGHQTLVAMIESKRRTAIEAKRTAALHAAAMKANDEFFGFAQAPQATPNPNAETPNCTCSMETLLASGCQCGGS